MKASDDFTAIISAYLQSVAQKDSLFAETLKKPNKNIDDCITYILNTVQKSGCSALAEAEVFNMAVHYYDEDDIKPGAKVNCKVVVSKGIDKLEEAIENRAPEEKKIVKKAVKVQPIISQGTLF